MVRVVAIERGHDGTFMRQPGEEFSVPDERMKDGKPADGSTWFVAVGKAPAPVAKPADSRPPGAGPLKGSRTKDAE